MWIRTQDKKELVSVIKVNIGRAFGDKNNKVGLYGQFAPNTLSSNNIIALGSYSTLDEALDELNEIEKSIIENPNGVYHMRSNK